jgi:hypothetical protein
VDALRLRFLLHVGLCALATTKRHNLDDDLKL